MLMIATTIAASFGSTVTSRMNDWSILSFWIGRRFRYDRLE